MPKKARTQPYEVTPTLDSELETFRDLVAQCDETKLAAYQAILNGEITKRRDHELNQVMQSFKTLSLEDQQRFLHSLQSASKKKAGIGEVEKPKKEKNPFRMYQDYSPDEDAQYKVAPLVNVELQEIFTGGNPQNKSWLADLSSEERREQFGTMHKLEHDPDFLETLMTIPKAVFKLDGEQWVDCCSA
jgi:hypothetical protein